MKKVGALLILSHFAEQDFVFDKARKYDQPSIEGYKPNGLWLSDEENGDHSWKQFCESESWNTESLVFEKKFSVDIKGCLYLKNLEELIDFTNKYGLTRGPFEMFRYIAWESVIKDYGGIVITPYCWDARLNAETHWYYGWDCASACVWDLSLLTEVVE